MKKRRALRKTPLLLVGTTASVLFNLAIPAHSAERSNNYTAFVAGLSALAVSASDALQNERNAARLAFVRRELTKKVIAAFPPNPGQAPVTDPNNTLSLAGVLNETSLLCEFRWKKIEVVK